MSKSLHGDELVLSILEKELVSLTKKAEKAKADCQATMTAGSAIIELRRKAAPIVNNTLGSYSKENLAKLKELADQEKKLVALAKRSLVKLMDAEFEAESTRDELAQIIAQMKFRLELRGRRG